MADLAAIRARAAAATPGPWHASGGALVAGPPPPRDYDDVAMPWSDALFAEHGEWLDQVSTLTYGDFDRDEDLEFAAHARQDVVDLLELVDTLIGQRPSYHVIEFGDADEGWALQHEAGCFPDLLDCDVHAAISEEMAEHEGPPVPPGRYRVRTDGYGRTYVGEEIEHG